MDAIYWKEECPKCHVINWMWCGSNDVEAFQCYKCRHKWLSEGSAEWIEDIEDAFLCEGREKLE